MHSDQRHAVENLSVITLVKRVALSVAFEISDFSEATAVRASSAAPRYTLPRSSEFFENSEQTFFIWSEIAPSASAVCGIVDRMNN